MNIQEELHKVFPIPQYDVISFLENNSEPLEGKEYIADAHARFSTHLKNCVTTQIARHKNINSNTDIMAAIMANDVKGLLAYE